MSFIPKKKGISYDALAGWCLTPRDFEMVCAEKAVAWTYGDGSVFLVRGPRAYHLVEIIDSPGVEDGVHDRKYRTVQTTPYSWWERFWFLLFDVRDILRSEHRIRGSKKTELYYLLADKGGFLRWAARRFL